jgi:hypothetical protein
MGIQGNVAVKLRSVNHVERLSKQAIVLILWHIRPLCKGRDSSVGIATRYGLDGPGIESRWGRDFPQPSRPALGPTQLPIQWVPGLSRGVKWPELGIDHAPPSGASGPSWPVVGWTVNRPLCTSVTETIRGSWLNTRQMVRTLLLSSTKTFPFVVPAFPPPPRNTRYFSTSCPFHTKLKAVQQYSCDTFVTIHTEDHNMQTGNWNTGFSAGRNFCQVVALTWRQGGRLFLISCRETDCYLYIKTATMKVMHKNCPLVTF